MPRAATQGGGHCPGAACASASVRPPRSTTVLRRAPLLAATSKVKTDPSTRGCTHDAGPAAVTGHVEETVSVTLPLSEATHLRCFCYQEDLDPAEIAETMGIPNLESLADPGGHFGLPKMRRSRLGFTF